MPNLRALLATVVPYVATLLPAQSPEPFRPADLGKPFPALAERVGGDWRAVWNPATGTPSAVFGTGLPLADWREATLAEARRHALACLRDHGDLLGLGSSEFRETIGARMGHVWSFTFDQYFRGLPCIGGRADVRVHRTGRIAMFGASAWPIPADFVVVPAIDAAAATAAAWLQVGGVPAAAAAPAARLVIHGDVTNRQRAPFSLAWEVPVAAPGPRGDGPIGRWYVDARTGRLLQFVTDKHECRFAGCRHTAPAVPPPAAPVPTVVTVSAWTRTGLSGVAALQNVPVPGLQVVVGGNTYTTDAQGQFIVDLAGPATATVGPLDGVHCAAFVDPTNQGPTAAVPLTPGVPATVQLFTAGATPEQAAHTSTYHWVHVGNEYLRGIVGNVPEMDLADQVVAHVNINGACNAYYTGNTINFYPTVGTCNNTAFSTVVLHEWGHGLDDRFGGISNNNGDGLSEGWADIVAMYCVDDPVVGLDFWNGSYIRHGMNGTMYGTQSEVHAAGQVWMGFAWRLRENLRASLGQASALAISADIVLGSIVADANDQQQAVLEVFVADDNDANLANGVPHYAELSAAAIAKGIPYPQIQVAWVQHTALVDTAAEYTPRLVTANTGVVAGGSITQVRLVYSAQGGANVVRPMVPSGAPDEWRGLLPGIGGGQVVYHVEAVHSSGNVVRAPLFGEYRYVVAPAPVGPFVPILTEGFEAGAPGWSHSAVAGYDEWQLGTPAGAAGSSYGVPWSDPSGAFTGAGAAGNDLGGGFGNGHYEANGVQSLRLPVLDCSSRRGVHVRFKRWLSVEESQYDKAQLLCNGNVVWQNPEFGQLTDIAWQAVEYAVPFADGHPAVQLEFVLASDAGLELGGWNLDDVEVGTRAIAPLPATFRWLPEQAGPGVLTTLTVNTPGQQIFAVGLSDQPGPTNLGIPGLPLLDLGAGMITFSAFTDLTGAYQTTIPSFPSLGATGLLWYGQVVTIDVGGQFQVSNPHRNLFTP